MTALRRIRAALRQFTDRPGLYGLLLAILALGVGVNAAMLGMGDAVLFRDMPVREPETIVRVFTRAPKGGDISNGSYPWFEGVRQLPVFEGAAAYSDWVSLNVATPGGATERLVGGLASGEFFDVLGVQTILGRTFGPEEDAALGQHPVAVVGERYWRTRMNADPSAVGSILRINRQAFTVLGVLPARFGGPSMGGDVDVWLPLAMTASALPEHFAGYRTAGDSAWLDVVARLAPGVTTESAQQAIDAWAIHKAKEGAPETLALGRGPHAQLMDLRTAAVDPYGTENQARNAWLLVAVAVLVLLIACANAAGLLAVRGDERAREIAVRMSLGASPRAILGQLLLEAGLLAVGALALGLLLATVLVQGVAALAPPGIILARDPITSVLQPRVLLLCAACAALSVFAAALLPARRALRLDVVDALRSGGQSTAGVARQRGRALLVGAQLTLTAVLLVGAGLLLRSLWNNASVDPGFAVGDTVQARVALTQAGQETAAKLARFTEIEQRVEALPGVKAAAWMYTAPVQAGGMTSTAETDVPGTPTGVDANAIQHIVSPGAFEALGVSLLRGRDFNERDDGTTPVAIVNRAYAERMFPGVDPIGRKIVSIARDQGGLTVVGVVSNHMQRNLRDRAQPQVYVPLALEPMDSMALVVNAPGVREEVLAALPRTVASIDPEIPVYRTVTLEQQVASSYADTRVFAWLLIGFGALAATLAGAGLFGILSHWVRGRTREIGIRVAVGATRRALARLVVRQCATLIAVSVFAGIVLSLPLGRAIEGMLFGVGTRDPLVLLGAAALLVVVATLAAVLPLRRALAINPTVALRYE